MKQELLKQYARFAVEVGVNPQSCQTLIINAPVEAADFARTCAEVAYEAGAKQVVVYYNDEKLSRIQMERTQVEVLEDVKPTVYRRYLDYFESQGGACILHIIASDPDIYAGIDPEKIARASKARSIATEPYREYVMKDKVQWTIVAIPSEAWAKRFSPRKQLMHRKSCGKLFLMSVVSKKAEML